MYSEQLRGKWHQIKGGAKIHWSNLTNDDLDRIAGNAEMLVGLVQTRHGYPRDRAASEVERFTIRYAGEAQGKLAL